MTHDGPEYNGTSENEKFFTILVQNDYLKPEELVSENVQLSDTVLAIRREQFIEYFKEVFRTFDENRYNIILQSHQTNNMVEGTVRENLQLLTEEMISNFVWVLDNPVTTQFSILSDHSNLKQLKASEYRIKYGDDSMWLDRMLDIACPIGPSVESASDDELENHIRSVYGRSTQQIVHFNEIVKKSFTIQETAQRVNGLIEPNSIQDRYIIGVAVWMGAMYGREEWEEEYPDQSLVFYDKVRREKDSISTQKIQNQLVALAEAKGITLRDLMGKIINIVEDTKDFTFAQFDKMYFTDMDDEDS